MVKPFIRLIKKNMPFIFNNKYIKAFKELKNRLISSLVLCYYNLNFKLMLKMDASDGVVVGVFL